MKKIYLSLLLTVFALTGCESLEDTYSDYTGDGPVRYVGKCENVQVLAGWNRLTVKWKNSTDPNVVNNRVTCTADEFAFDTIVPAVADSCDIFGLADATYNVTVEALDADGKASLSEPVTGRPYTDAHEAVKSFPRGVVKSFFVGDQVLLMLGGNESFADFIVEYVDVAGNEVTRELGWFDFEIMKRVLLEQVDVEKPVSVRRRGFLEGCSDTIPIAPYELEDDPVLRPDFKAALAERYGMTDFSREALDKVTELELDYDLGSLEDVLYFTNLEKLYLGKNRYLSPDCYYGWSVLPYDETANSLYCLDLANRQGVEIYHYGDLYFSQWDDTYGCTIQQEKAVWPENLELLGEDSWKAAFSVDDRPDGYQESYLWDDDPQTSWYSLSSSGQRNVEVTIDMQEALTVDGLKINQVGGYGMQTSYKPSSAIVQVSADGQAWEVPTYANSSTLGATDEEVTRIRFKQSYTVRYIRLTLSDVGIEWNNTWGIVLGDVIPYREIQ